MFAALVYGMTREQILKLRWLTAWAVGFGAGCGAATSDSDADDDSSVAPTDTPKPDVDSEVRDPKASSVNLPTPDPESAQNKGEIRAFMISDGDGNCRLQFGFCVSVCDHMKPTLKAECLGVCVNRYKACPTGTNP